MVPKSPRNKSKVLLLPSQSTFARCKAMNQIHVATPHLKKTNSLVGRCARFFTITFISANQKVANNMCLTPGVIRLLNFSFKRGEIIRKG